MASPIGRVLLMDKGAYSGSTVYNQLDWVRDNGAAWVCKVDGTVGIAPPTLPTTSNANWTLMAADGSVSGSIEWSAVNNKPFDDIDTTEFEKDALNNLRLKNPNNFGTIKVDSHLLYASCANDTIEFEAGNNVTITTDNVSNPNKITIAATGGGGGSSTLSGLSDVNLNTPTNDQVLKYDSSSSKWVNGTAPQGGHTMIPNNTAIASLTSKATDNTDDDVASGYAIANWSNTECILLLTTLSADADTIGAWTGTWKTESPLDRSGWIWHECLYNIIADDEVEMRVVNGISGKEIGCLYAFRVDDNYPRTINGNTVNGGCMALKFNNTLSAGTKVGIKLVRQRTQKIDITPLS